MEKPMMKCGHVANANSKTGEPCCVICIGLKPGASEVDYTIKIEDLIKTRQARCSCGKKVPSSLSLAFFEYRGPGSASANQSCKVCNYSYGAHDKEQMSHNVPSNRLTVVEQGKCTGFVPRTEGFEFDSYYCGHAGWN